MRLRITIFKVDISGWKSDEDKFYMHLKREENRHTRLIFGIMLNRIYRRFELYENDQFVDEPIEAMFDNFT